MTSGDAHGSDRLYDAQLALKSDGTMLSMRLKVIDDYGAYFQYGVGQHGNAMAQVTGPYKINSVQVDLTAVLTNKCQQGAYRGFGSEVGNFVIERLVDAACEELGIDPIEMRRRNLIEQDQFPYIMPTGNMYDSGNYQAVLDEALGMIDVDGLAQEAGGGPRGRPLHRHRHLHLPGAERLQRHRILDVEPERDSGLHALELAGERGRQHRPYRQGVHHAERALLGQQSGDHGRPGSGREAGDGPCRHLRRLRRFRQGLQLVGPRRQPGLR